MNPVIILFSLGVWYIVWGTVGAMLAVPLTRLGLGLGLAPTLTLTLTLTRTLTRTRIRIRTLTSVLRILSNHLIENNVGMPYVAAVSSLLEGRSLDLSLSRVSRRKANEEPAADTAAEFPILAEYAGSPKTS